VGARFSASVPTGPKAHPASCTMGSGSFPGVESGRGLTLIPHPLLVARSKNRVELYPLLSLRAFVAYGKGETYLYHCAVATLQFHHGTSSVLSDCGCEQSSHFSCSRRWTFLFGVKLQAFSTLSVKITVFWRVMPCSLVGVLTFTAIYCFL
jgi:hypothetical protein